LRKAQIEDQVELRRKQKKIENQKYVSLKNLIKKESEKGRTLKELTCLMVQNNPSNEHLRSELWKEFLINEYRKGRTFQELTPFITAQNIPKDILLRDCLEFLISNEYNRGRTFHELIPFMTRLPLSGLWDYVIRKEYRNGRTFEELISFVKPQYIPNEETWYRLLHDMMTRFMNERTFQEVTSFITAQNIPDKDTLSTLNVYVFDMEMRNMTKRKKPT
jgi:hypothetical protein